MAMSAPGRPKPRIAPPRGAAQRIAASVGAQQPADLPARAACASVVRRRRRADRRPHLRRRPRPRVQGVSALDGVAMHRLAAPASSSRGSPAAPRRRSTHRAQQLAHPALVLDAHDKRRAMGAAAQRARHRGRAMRAHRRRPAGHAGARALAGFGVTVPHAPAAVRAHAHYVTARDGGSGAVRELADLILAAQGHDDGASVVPADAPVLAPCCAEGRPDGSHARPVRSSRRVVAGAAARRRSRRSRTGSMRRCSRRRRGATDRRATTRICSCRISRR